MVSAVVIQEVNNTRTELSCARDQSGRDAVGQTSRSSPVSAYFRAWPGTPEYMIDGTLYCCRHQSGETDTDYIVIPSDHSRVSFPGDTLNSTYNGEDGFE